MDISPLASALKENSSLLRAYLGQNKILDISPLSEALKANSSLEGLDLSDNKITDISSLTQPLIDNTSLQLLKLSRNQIPVHAMNALWVALPDRPHLTLELDLPAHA